MRAGPRSVTVFVQDVGRGYCATTYAGESFGPTAELAARRAAARHLDVQQELLEIIPENDHVHIARIRDERVDAHPCSDHPLRSAAVTLLVTLAAALVLIVITKGGTP